MCIVVYKHVCKTASMSLMFWFEFLRDVFKDSIFIIYLTLFVISAITVLLLQQLNVPLKDQYSFLLSDLM